MISASTLPTLALAKTTCTLGNQRKHKAHTKSRAGCGNCKIRRVKHPFLMHAVLAFTYSHDRHLQPVPEKADTTELFHNYKGTALLNYRLSGDVNPSERDAIICSKLVGQLRLGEKYCADRGSRMEQNRSRVTRGGWPLKDLGPGEPDCLALSQGKSEIMDFCDPSRPESCFRSVLVKGNIEGGDADFTPLPAQRRGFRNLPGPLLDFLELTDPLVGQSSPYYRAANIVSQLIPIQHNQGNLLKFATLIYLMAPEFRQLWVKKDPGVLLLTSYWYAKTIPYQQWWAWKRAVLECQAICIFLERYHDDEIPHLERLLEFPKRSCGLVW